MTVILYDPVISGTCPLSLEGENGLVCFAFHGIPAEGEAGGLSVKLVCKAGEGVLHFIHSYLLIIPEIQFR